MTGNHDSPMPVAGDLHPARLLDLIGTTHLVGTVVLIDRCASTNTVAVEAAVRGAGEGTVLIAGRQYAGRGRVGRQWLSIPGVDLTFSIIVRPARGGEGLTPLMALAAAQALGDLSIGVDVKWPNDLYLDGRKLGGILAEGRETFIVLGMGINVNGLAEDFSEEIAAEAISLRIRTGALLDRGYVLARVLKRFAEGYGEWSRSGFQRFRRALEDRLLYRGELVQLYGGDETIEGTVLGITDEGYLRLEVNGTERVYAAGDLSLHRV